LRQKYTDGDTERSADANRKERDEDGTKDENQRSGVVPICIEVRGKQKYQRVDVVYEKELQPHVREIHDERTHRDDDKGACRE
jgi:hypothetical protein